MSEPSPVITTISDPVRRDNDDRQLLAGTPVAALLERIARLEEQAWELKILNAQLQQNAEHLAKQVFVDSLTGLGNRRYVDSAIDLEIRSAERTGRSFALLLCDIDSFKHYNDAYGHARGDAVLAQIAALLKMFCRREDDRAGRYGGEEFVVLLPGLGSDGAIAAAEQLRIGVAGLAIGHADTQVERVTISIGATSNQCEPRSQRRQLLEAADEALYRAKRAGRNRTEYQEVRPKV